MTRQQPRSMTSAWAGVLVLVGLGGLVAALTVVLREDLVDSWAAGDQVRSRAGRYDQPAGVRAGGDHAVRGARRCCWACCTCSSARATTGRAWRSRRLVVVLAFATVAGLRTGPPTVFVVLSLLSLVLDAALLVLLWHRDTSAYMRGAWLESHRDSSPTS